MHVLKYLATLSLALVMASIAGCDDPAHRAWVLAGVPLPTDDDSDIVETPDEGPVIDLPCIPNCGDRVCGLDPVCGESCGLCKSGQHCDADGQCKEDKCVPNCTGRVCGPDPVCGESCGTCTAPKTCNSSGQCECIKDCTGRVCGPDPVCGQSCGTCTAPNTCNSSGQCECVKDCSGRVCGLDPVCGESCGTCTAPNICNSSGRCQCIKDCTGRVCGLDPVCRQLCGICVAPTTCNSSGQCECVKDCTGRVCGPDPVCGESCGSCTAPGTCNSEGQCCLKDCTGRVCGPDPVCGQSCGSCGSNTHCDSVGKCIPNDSDIEWVRIEGGSFNMGSDDDDSWDGEQPVHRVTVPTFEMSKTAVTFKQYQACVSAGDCTAAHVDDGMCRVLTGSGVEPGTLPSSFQGDDQPVVCVDWDQAQAFARWVGGRLPSEAEWEYAARSGGRDWKYPWGNEEATCERAVMCDGSGPGCGRNSTWPVCSKPNGNTTHGLCDMAGNVWEWVQDWYHNSYDGAPTDGSAWESPPDSYRVGRGGYWLLNAWCVRAANRDFIDPLSRNNHLGFRVARDSL